MQRYGGLVPQGRVPVAWLGLTERYEESLLLFYDWVGWQLDDKFRENIPKRRFKPCRPTSFWTKEEQMQLSRLVRSSWVVHNVANAVLDLRMAEWCCRRKYKRKDALSTVEAEFFQQYCLEPSAGATV